MKPQCTTAAQCLRELARVMEQFGIKRSIDALNSKYVKFDDEGHDDDGDSFTCPESWKFAIAEVEGKPVFPGDELYGNTNCAQPNQRKVYVKGMSKNDYIEMTDGGWFKANDLSWNPPKKTVMVELPYEFVETHSKFISDTTLINACKKALETK